MYITLFLHMMKRTLLILIYLFTTALIFAKELEGKNLQAVNKALDAQLYVNNYEELSDQLAYLQKIEKQILAYGDTISDEAKLLCKNILIMQKETAKSADAAKKNKDKKKKVDKEATEAAKAFSQSIYDEYKAFADSHSDLSCHFYLHYLEAQMATLAYLPKTKQLGAAKQAIEEFKKIDEKYPDYAESLYTYGMILYVMPKIAGGDKEAAMAKIKHAAEVPASNFEKAGALLLYSQILFKEKKPEEAKIYFNKAKALNPESKSFKEMQKMNDAGFSIFEMKEYLKKTGKNK